MPVTAPAYPPRSEKESQQEGGWLQAAWLCPHQEGFASCGRLLHWLPPMDHVFQNSHFCVVPPTLILGLVIWFALAHGTLASLRQAEAWYSPCTKGLSSQNGSSWSPAAML